MEVIEVLRHASHRTYMRTEVHVTGCRDCPFGRVGRKDPMDWGDTAHCNLTGCGGTWLDSDTILPDCPLKKAGKRGKLVHFFLETK